MTEVNGNSAASATWLTGLTFSVLAAPLAMFGAQPLDVSLGDVNIRGPLDNYAVEYLGAAAIASLGIGATRLMKASVSSSQTKGASNSSFPPVSLDGGSNSRHDVALLTEDSLKASGLHMFLEEDDAPLVVHRTSNSAAAPATQAVGAPQAKAVAVETVSPGAVSPKAASLEVAGPVSSKVSPSQPASQSFSTPEALESIVAEVQSIVQQLAEQSQVAVAAPTAATATVQKAAVSAPAVQVSALPLAGHRTTPSFPAAQSYVSFARAKAVAEQSVARDLTGELDVLDQIYQVRAQMQHLMNQVDLIQADLEQTVYPAQRLVPLRAAQTPSYTVSAVEPLRSDAA